MFFLVWKLSSKSLSRAPVRQNAAVMISKKCWLNANQWLVESCFSAGLSRVPEGSDKTEWQTEASGVRIMTTPQNRI